MSQPVRRRRITAASPTPAKLATFLRHLQDSGSVSTAAARTGIARALGGDNRLRKRQRRDSELLREDIGVVRRFWATS